MDIIQRAFKKLARIGIVRIGLRGINRAADGEQARIAQRILRGVLGGVQNAIDINLFLTGALIAGDNHMVIAAAGSVNIGGGVERVIERAGIETDLPSIQGGGDQVRNAVREYPQPQCPSQPSRGQRPRCHYPEWS